MNFVKYMQTVWEKNGESVQIKKISFSLICKYCDFSIQTWAEHVMPWGDPHQPVTQDDLYRESISRRPKA
jgi:hypothetical protein